MAFYSDSLHGDLTQAQRDKVMAGIFRTKILINTCCNRCSCGIDVNDITQVMQYNLPDLVKAILTVVVVQQEQVNQVFQFHW
ncbi:MAG: hypothetical protein IPI10_14520 [Bacteroidetes bacterium]|nr:hypothetical protein [Bacteroidota bacterium]